MPKHKLFCFNCRTTKRTLQIACTNYELSHPSNICQHCREKMFLSYNYPTPKKNDDKGWRNLERTIYRILRKNEVSEAWINTNYVRNKMRELQNENCSI